MPSKSVRDWNVDFDQFLNPFIPPPPRNYLPHFILHFLGYRQPDHEPFSPLGNVLVSTWAFLGTLASLSLVYILCHAVPLFQNLDDDVPMILGSFGAAAVLHFHALEAPLAQPRNAILGQLLATLIGISISKACPSTTPSTPTASSPRWFAGALSTSLSLFVMGLTNTVHPPAGATALLAVTDPSVVGMGWTLVPFVMLSVAGMLSVACVVNNVQRRFPLYWWTAGEVGGAWRRLVGRHGDGQREEREVGAVEEGRISWGKEGGQAEEDDKEVEEREGSIASRESRTVTVSKRGIVVPGNVYLRPEERILLDGLVRRL